MSCSIVGVLILKSLDSRLGQAASRLDLMMPNDERSCRIGAVTFSRTERPFTKPSLCDRRV